MTMEAIYDTEYNIQQALPPKPDYVHSLKLGIIDANVMTRHTKISGIHEANKCLGRLKSSIFGSKKSVWCNVTPSNSLSRKSGPAAMTSFLKIGRKQRMKFKEIMTYVTFWILTNLGTTAD